jgi:hypothetical protein
VLVVVVAVGLAPTDEVSVTWKFSVAAVGVAVGVAVLAGVGVEPPLVYVPGSVAVADTVHEVGSMSGSVTAYGEPDVVWTVFSPVLAGPVVLVQLTL